MSASAPYQPEPRWGHTSVTIGDRVFMWGGRIDDFSDSAKKELSNIVNIFHISTERWEKKKTKGKPPLGLYNNAFTAIGEDLYVYGGWDGQAAHNTLHKLNTNNLTWQEMKSSDGKETPMKMSGCGLVAKGTEELVLFGGYGLPTTLLSPEQQKKKKNVSLLTTTSGRSSSRQSSGQGGSGGVSLESTQSQGEQKGGSEIGLAKPGGSSGEGGRRRKRSDKARREHREGRKPRSAKGSQRSAAKEEEKGVAKEGGQNGVVAGEGESEGMPNGSQKTSPQNLRKSGEEKEKLSGEETRSSGLTNGLSHEEEGVNGREEGLQNESEGRKGGEVSELKAVDVEIHNQQENMSRDSEETKLIIGGETGKENGGEKIVNGEVWMNRDAMEEAENQEMNKEESTDDGIKDEDGVITNGGDSSENKNVEVSAAGTEEEPKASKLVDSAGLSAEERRGEGDITEAATASASKAEQHQSVEETLTVVGEVLAVMGGSTEEEGRVTEEEVVVVNKRWTNELKVYNIRTGTWSSPEVGGACPPPCVDFSFDSIDEGLKAVLFGGYRPESGASSGAFVLDMEAWTWMDLGNHESSTRNKKSWPVGRDGHTSCIITGLPHPHILVSGGWDQDNKLLNDAWILDVEVIAWKKLSVPEKVGPRLWHRVVSRKASSNLWDLLFFGGCPGIPDDISAMGGLSWPKLNSTVLLELGRMKNPVPSVPGSMRRSIHSAPKHDWVVLDSMGMEQMGKEKLRSREALLFTKYRAAQAEVRAKKAEKLAHDAMKKLNEVLAMLQSGSYSIPSISPISHLESGLSTPIISTKSGEMPFWVIPRCDVQITMEEVGRGRWTIIRVAHYKGQRVAARCFHSQIISEYNHKLFQESLDFAAKLRHPNILPFIGAVLEGEPVILTELMPTNLKRVLDIEKLHNYQIAGVAVDVASALYFLHTMKPEPVVHGDLVSTSVLMQKESGNMWKAKLSDFVTAKFFQKMLISGGITGDSDQDSIFSPIHEAPPYPMGARPRSVSPPYKLSPTHKGLAATSELPVGRRLPARKVSQATWDMQDNSALSPQRDVYSLGLLLVEMCTGTPPLEVSLHFLIESITWTEMTAVIKACTDYNSDLRPSVDAILSHLKGINDLVKTRLPRQSLAKGFQ